MQYKAHFDAAPANQRCPQILVSNDFVEQSFMFGELQNGVTYVVPRSAP